MMCSRAASQVAATFGSAIAIAGAAGCGGGGGFPDASQEIDAFQGGTLSLDWSLVKMSDGMPIGCDQVGGGAVTLLLRNRGFQGGFTEVFSCSTKMGTTPPVPIGTYDVNFELTGDTGLITTAPQQTGLVVTQGQNTPLAPVTFTVNAVGGLDLRVDALKTGGNCAAVAANGAGITGMRITLNHASGGACEPATIMIGSTPYTINCGTPVTTGCIEKTTAITAPSLPADTYVIHVRADQAAAVNCFVNDDSFRVPPNGMSLMRTLNLAGSGGAGCL